MRQSKAKLFRKIFKDQNSWRNFKRTYVRSSTAKRIEVSDTARKMKGKVIHHVR